MESLNATPDSRLLDLLRRASVSFDVHMHPKLHSVADSKRLRGSMPGAHVKNLVLRDSKRTLYLLTSLEDRNVDIKALRKTIGASGSLSFVKPDVLLAALDSEPGSVSPLSLINDFGKQVRFFMDKAIFDYDVVNVLALRPDMTLSLSPHRLVGLLESDDHRVTVIELSADRTR